MSDCKDYYRDTGTLLYNFIYNKHKKSERLLRPYLMSYLTCQLDFSFKVKLIEYECLIQRLLHLDLAILHYCHCKYDEVP